MTNADDGVANFDILYVDLNNSGRIHMMKLVIQILAIKSR